MKKNIIKSSLFSLFLHGILLACCFALPAQKLVPLFQAGNSSLTLTSLSISMPDDAQSNAHKRSSDKESELEVEADDPGINSEAEEGENDFPVVPEKKASAAASPKPQARKMPLDADARLKGVINGLSESGGIRPYYPLGARLRGEEGIVKIAVCVGTDGCVLDCAVAKSSGYPALDKAALAAVKHARFISARSLALQDENRTVLTFRFDLVD